MAIVHDGEIRFPQFTVLSDATKQFFLSLDFPVNTMSAEELLYKKNSQNSENKFKFKDINIIKKNY